jgi:hypothetical protein
MIGLKQKMKTFLNHGRPTNASDGASRLGSQYVYPRQGLRKLGLL